METYSIESLLKVQGGFRYVASTLSRKAKEDVSLAMVDLLFRA